MFKFNSIYRFYNTRKYPVIIFILLCLFIVDLITSKMNKTLADPVVDSLIYESGNEEIDGYTQASIKTHVSIIKSDNAELSFSKTCDQNLTPDEIREMVFLAIKKQTYFGTLIPELKYKINKLGNNAWVAIKANIVMYPGQRYTQGDQTDPRVFWAVLDYIADSTNAKRISLLAGGGYWEKDAIFENSSFGGSRWNHYFPGLSNDFSLKSIVTAAQTRNPGKILECIDLNYNEILDGGIPYNELTAAQRAGKMPEIYPIPADARNIGGLSTINLESDGGYNPTDAIYNCDFLVNVPVMKTTPGTVINCVMKNYIGSVSRAVYSSGTGYPRSRSSSLTGLEHGDALMKTVVNLFSYHPSDYCVVDAICGLEGEGSHPWGVRTGFLRRNFILAGVDPIAVEAVGAASMNINPNDIQMLRWGQAKGWGYYELENIAVEGDPLSSVQMDVKGPADHTSSDYAGFQLMHFFERGCRRWLLNGPYTASDLTTMHIDETNISPYPGDIANDKNWATYYSPENFVDLASVIPATETNSVVYGFSRIYSRVAQSGLAYIGGARDIKVYINGEVILDTAGIIDYNDVNAVKDVTLRQGDNTILVKVRRSGATYGFSLGIVNDGSLSSRNMYIPHSDAALGAPVLLTSEMKMSYFGGRTLFNTFYHLGKGNSSIKNKWDIDYNNDKMIAVNPNPFTNSTNISFD
ncbi:MAG: DUF362 domain-containing protein, partial [bacterium]